MNNPAWFTRIWNRPAYDDAEYLYTRMRQCAKEKPEKDVWTHGELLQPYCIFLFFSCNFPRQDVDMTTNIIRQGFML